MNWACRWCPRRRHRPVGGALPPGDGVLLSLAKFMRVLRIDRLARVAVVQPGCATRAISDVVAPFGLYYAPDPSSQIACSIGGNVAENSGRRALPEVRPDGAQRAARARLHHRGRAVDFGSEALDSPGYDLLALAIGSEGLLAVTTEVTVKLLPKPEAARVIMASFDDVQKAGDAVAAVIAAGIVPAGLEMMDKPATARGGAVRARGLRPGGGGDPAVRSPTACAAEVEERSPA
jgi:glycolate oxidase